MKKTRILIADDHDVVRSGLRMLLRTSPEFSVTGEAADGEEAVRLVEKQKPDIAIMDISMPKLDGIEATKIITKNTPGTRVIILTVHEDEEYAFHVLRAGASGYLLKNASRKEIFDAIRSAMAGERFFSPGISKLIVDGFMKRANEGNAGTHTEEKKDASAGQQLTKRELEVLQYIAQGFTNRQIADALFLSFRTVNTHRANLMQKLNIHDTAGLVRHAISLGLVKSGS
ncbi:MAG TPA: response regulator transcription factor [Bacteroidota bacterium]|nr:response regulator transcription factor [Bacteroidota bacterium]